ncbi:MAG: ABC transporter substrate-binding protein [Chloroflexota bacterium]
MMGTPVALAPPEVTDVEIWAVRDPQEASAFSIADQLGYFKDAGLNVTIKWIVSGTDMPNLVATGQVNFYGESGFSTTQLKDKGIDVRYVMPLADISGTQDFVVGPNVTLKTPKDLEGKKVGMAAGAGVAIAITGMAKQYGVDFSKITFVNLQPPDQISALAHGDIDAMAVWQPWSLAGVKLGGKLYFSGNTSYIEGTEQKVNWMYFDSGLNVRGEFLDKNPNTVQAVMSALIRATDYIDTTPIEKVADTLSGPLNVPKEDLAIIMKQNIYSYTVDQHVIDGMTALQAWMLDQKVVAKSYTPKDIYDLKLLGELAPDAVKQQP